MVVFIGPVKSKALVCLVFSHLLLVWARGNYSVIKSRTKRTIVEEEAEILKINKQITVFLSGKESRVYQYLDIETHDHNLSVTVTPCSTTVKWSFVYHTVEELKTRNSTEFAGDDETGENYENDGMKTVTVERAQKGWYFIIFQPLGKEARVSIYLTMDGIGPYELTIPQKSNLLLVPLRRHRLRVSWQPRFVCGKPKTTATEFTTIPDDNCDPKLRESSLTPNGQTAMCTKNGNTEFIAENKSSRSLRVGAMLRL